MASWLSKVATSAYIKHFGLALIVAYNLDEGVSCFFESRHGTGGFFVA